MKLSNSRLHFLPSRDLLIIHFRGRNSGKRFSAPLGYVEVDDRLYLFARPTAAVWWKNMRGGVAVEILWRGQMRPARATLLDSASDEALIGFRSYLKQFPASTSMLYRVEVRKGARMNEGDVQREIRRSAVVRIEVLASAAHSEDLDRPRPFPSA